MLGLTNRFVALLLFVKNVLTFLNELLDFFMADSTLSILLQSSWAEVGIIVIYLRLVEVDGDVLILLALALRKIRE